jgi:hypothetical protein
MVPKGRTRKLIVITRSKARLLEKWPMRWATLDPANRFSLGRPGQGVLGVLSLVLGCGFLASPLYILRFHADDIVCRKPAVVATTTVRDVYPVSRGAGK